jgi:hypothetical protein
MRKHMMDASADFAEHLLAFAWMPESDGKSSAARGRNLFHYPKSYDIRRVSRVINAGERGKDLLLGYFARHATIISNSLKLLKAHADRFYPARANAFISVGGTIDEPSITMIEFWR